MRFVAMAIPRTSFVQVPSLNTVRGPKQWIICLHQAEWIKMSSPGVEPGLSRPQRDVLTTRRWGLDNIWNMVSFISAQIWKQEHTKKGCRDGEASLSKMARCSHPQIRWQETWPQLIYMHTLEQTTQQQAMVSRIMRSNCHDSITQLCINIFTVLLCP